MTGSQEDAGDLSFSAVERRLKAYLVALWGLRVPVRPAAPDAVDGVPRRVSFGDGLVWMPETFRGVAGQRAADLFRASLAHVGAHLRHSGPRFPAGSLKPLQIALVSLVEDARVERLAMRGHPGLFRVWAPFHLARPGGAATAPALMARLARALFDPAYEDDDAWVDKGRRLFAERSARWEDPSISREIGNLLGNDLGQMRVQFNARTHVVEPAYRDDNAGLWDFGGDPPQGLEAETVYEAFRTEHEEVEDGAPQADPGPTPPEAPPPSAPAAPPQAEEILAPPVRYPEWDYLIGRERPDWVRVEERSAYEGSAASIDRTLDRHRAVADRLTALVRSARVSRPAWLRRQPEGDRLDLDACIEAALDRRRGESPGTRVYATLARRHRDLSVLLLLDVSASTSDLVRGTTRTILTVEREATALFAHVLEELGDPFAVHAFRSNGREEVRYYRIKDFRRPYGPAAKARLAGLEAGLSTRLGTALRHAGRSLARQPTHRRLLLVVTDGEPSDVDVADRRYLAEDARRAVLGLSHLGIDCFGIGLDPQGRTYLARMFGQRNFMVIDRVERLPEKLPALYLRLTH
ncbi:VWA domain-containing protein [Arenibaculum sp.]|uniref:nitric oxide reductase activation protein NorD n=1 Tax=Arenibaculum sp. TaxID=2865862 RepID=UPI002E0DC2E3|nr:VWA domain-containing protein [Arenibaculum sp.]